MPSSEVSQQPSASTCPKHRYTRSTPDIDSDPQSQQREQRLKRPNKQFLLGMMEKRLNQSHNYPTNAALADKLNREES